MMRDGEAQTDRTMETPCKMSNSAPMSSLRKKLLRLRIDRANSKEEKRQREDQEKAERLLEKDEQTKNKLLEEAAEAFKLKTAEDSFAEYFRQRDLSDACFRGIWEAKTEEKKVSSARPVLMDVEFSNDGFEYADYEAFGMVRYHMIGQDIVPNGPDESIHNQIPNNLIGSKYGRNSYIIPDHPLSTIPEESATSQPTEFPMISSLRRASTALDDEFGRSPPLTERCFDETDFEFSNENLLVNPLPARPTEVDYLSDDWSASEDFSFVRGATASASTANLTEESQPCSSPTSLESFVLPVGAEVEPNNPCCSSSLNSDWSSANEELSDVPVFPFKYQDGSARKRFPFSEERKDEPILKKTKQNFP